MFKVDEGKGVILERPTLEEAAEAIKNAIARRETVVALLRCRVEYEGRSSSILEPGDRLLILKQDGAVLVHRPTGYSPVNWQPDTSYVRVEVVRDTLRITAVRSRPREVLNIEASEVHAVVTMSLTDSGAFYELADESTIRDALARNPNVLGEHFETIDVEKHVEPGFIDLYLRDQEGRLVVVEIKRVKASASAVRQLRKYVDALSKHAARERIRPILVAPDFTSSAIVAARKLSVELKRIDLKRLLEERRRSFERERRGLLDYLEEQ